MACNFAPTCSICNEPGKPIKLWLTAGQVSDYKGAAEFMGQRCGFGGKLGLVFKFSKPTHQETLMFAIARKEFLSLNIYVQASRQGGDEKQFYTLLKLNGKSLF